MGDLHYETDRVRSLGNNSADSQARARTGSIELYSKVVTGYTSIGQVQGTFAYQQD